MRLDAVFVDQPAIEAGRGIEDKESTRCLRWVDAVGKVGFSIGVAFWGADAAEMSRLLWFEVAGSGSDLHATDAITINAQASDARRRVGGGPRIRSASVLRFCTMAAR